MSFGSWHRMNMPELTVSPGLNSRLSSKSSQDDLDTRNPAPWALVLTSCWSIFSQPASPSAIQFSSWEYRFDSRCEHPFRRLNAKMRLKFLAAHLIPLHRFKQCLKVTFTKSLVFFPFNKFEEYGTHHRFRKYLQQQSGFAIFGRAV